MSGSGLLRTSLAYRAARWLRETLKRYGWGLSALVLAAVSAYLLHLLSFVRTGPPNALSELHIAARTSWPTVTLRSCGLIGDC
jgi:hypothetical protein